MTLVEITETKSTALHGSGSLPVVSVEKVVIVVENIGCVSTTESWPEYVMTNGRTLPATSRVLIDDHKVEFTGPNHRADCEAFRESILKQLAAIQ